jgi:hypothetical protein
VSLFALVSPGAAAGVTTTALALSLTWPAPVIVAECDPAGGAILAGLFAGHLRAPRGLLGVAFEAGRGTAPLSVAPGGHLAALDGSGSRMLLAGLSDPRQARGVAPAWPAIARLLASQRCDVIADCGRLDASSAQPVSVIAAAAVAVMVIRPTLRQVYAARPRIEMLLELRGGPQRLGILLIGDRGQSPTEITKALGVPVLARMPFDARTASVLSDGVGRRASLAGKPLMRAARAAGLAISNAGRPGDQPGALAIATGDLR